MLGNSFSFLGRAFIYPLLNLASKPGKLSPGSSWGTLRVEFMVCWFVFFFPNNNIMSKQCGQ